MSFGLDQFNLKKLFWTISSLLSIILFLSLKNDFEPTNFVGYLIVLVISFISGACGAGALLMAISIFEVAIKAIIAWLKK